MSDRTLIGLLALKITDGYSSKEGSNRSEIIEKGLDSCLAVGYHETMNVVLASNNYDFKKSLTVEWTDFDLMTVELDAFDLAFLRECDNSTSMADKILAVEMLVRKHERSHHATSRMIE